MPSLELRVPATLREFTHGATTTRLEAPTVGDALRSWSAAQPPLARRLFGVDGRLRESIALYLNDRPLEGAARAETPLCDGDRLEIVATLAGG